MIGFEITPFFVFVVVVQSFELYMCILLGVFLFLRFRYVFAVFAVRNIPSSLSLLSTHFYLFFFGRTDGRTIGRQTDYRQIGK